MKYSIRVRTLALVFLIHPTASVSVLRQKQVALDVFQLHIGTYLYEIGR